MEDGAATPAGESAPTPGSGEAAVGAGEGVASVGAGVAPGAGGDAPAAGEGAEGAVVATPASLEPPAEFLFNKRKFRDQAHAENVYGTLDTEKRGLQRQSAERGTRVTALEAELSALRGLIPQQKGNGKGQGDPTGETPESLAQKLAKSGDLTYYAGLAVNEEGQITQAGLAKAMFALTEDLSKDSAENLKTAVTEIRGEGSARELRTATETSIARAFTAVSNLIEEFPELDENNVSPDAVAAQNAVLDLLNATPQVPGPNGELVSMGQVWLSKKPAEALRWAIESHRRTNGIPVSAKSPGSSESTSAKAAAAAEKKAAAAGSTPMDGTGVPRAGGKSPGELTAEDKWRKESATVRPSAKTPSGRSLGFEETA